ncbi:MAG TPA: CRISPR-associated endonuclease Cas3'' [Limnochordia bacterium]|nr:CRISPR-associated endonuclease Cas3'' [Limnochordia bacterium]HPU65929.1 CRISPR-associated endonuclease Cas3'' [Limnochordia bacterium]
MADRNVRKENQEGKGTMTGMDDGMDFIAHVCQDEKGNGLPPHPLEQHLLNTAELAGKFASKFNSGLWGKLAGFSHDAGKGRCAWQYYHRQKSGYFDEEAHLEGKPGKMAYAIFGAKLVEEIHGKQIGRVISCCVAGHHGGLQDWSGGEGAGKSSLEYQLSQVDAVNDIHTPIRDVLGTVRPQALPWAFSSGLDISLWIRMLYSCLVDPHPGWIAVPSPLVIRCDAAAVPTLRRRSPGRPIARSRKEIVHVQIGAKVAGYSTNMARPIVLGYCSNKLRKFMEVGCATPLSAQKREAIVLQKSRDATKTEGSVLCDRRILMSCRYFSGCLCA